MLDEVKTVAKVAEGTYTVCRVFSSNSIYCFREYVRETYWSPLIMEPCLPPLSLLMEDGKMARMLRQTRLILTIFLPPTTTVSRSIGMEEYLGVADDFLLALDDFPGGTVENLEVPPFD